MQINDKATGVLIYDQQNKIIWAQVSLQEMPAKHSDQPEIIDRLKFSDWIVVQLSDVMRDKSVFRAHLDPSRANFLDHDLLFSDLPEGIKLVLISSPATIWGVTRCPPAMVGN